MKKMAIGFGVLMVVGILYSQIPASITPIGDSPVLQRITTASGSSSAPSYSYVASPSSGLTYFGGVATVFSGAYIDTAKATGRVMSANYLRAWSQTAGDPSATPDTALGRGAAGLIDVTKALVIGTTPANAGQLRTGPIRLVETTADLSAANLTVAGSDALDVGGLYVKNDKLVIAVNRSGTVNYLTIPLDGTTTTWSWSTSAP